MGRLILLSGPSCVGKSPLHAALGKFHADAAAKLTKLVLFNSRSPRPAEIDGRDYHFRSREEIESYRQKSGFVVLDVRGDLQAIAFDDVDRALSSGDLLFEGNPFVASKLQSEFASRVGVLSVFLAPLSREEILHRQSAEQHVVLADFVTDVMRRKLLRRTQRQKGILSLKDLENIPSVRHAEHSLPLWTCFPAKSPSAASTGRKTCSREPRALPARCHTGV
jgi:guanylate kinase